MKWKVQRCNYGGTLAVVALLLSVKSLYDLLWAIRGRSSEPVCGQGDKEVFFSFASFLGFGLGYWALMKVTKAWLNLLVTQRSDAGHRYEWIAVFAMGVAMPAMALSVSSWPNLTITYDLQPGRETAAIQTLRTIHNNQAQFQAMRNRFGTLTDLANAGLIDSYYANGKTVSGYKYNSSDVTADTYCVRASLANPKCGSRNFIVCEDGGIRYVESPTFTLLKRGEGKPFVAQIASTPSPTP